MTSALSSACRSDPPEHRRQPVLQWYQGTWPERIRLWSLLGFLALLCLTGGSSRATVASLLLLRPVSVCILVTLLCLPDRRAWGALRWPAILLAVWAAVIAIQLVPLPFALWSALPGRDRYVGALAVLGERPWHAISLFPDYSWASLLDLLTPLIVLVAYRDLADRQRVVLLPALFVLALACALLGVAQMSGGAGSVFYLYSYATQDSPVGFFANRNHESVALVAMLPLLRAWMIAAPTSRAMSQRTWIAAMLALLLIAAAIVTGSRAGLTMLVLAMLGTVLVRPSLQGFAKEARRPLLIAIGAAAAIAILMATFALSGRLPALSRLMSFASDDELRFRYLPILKDMIRTFFPIGSGFGSFEPLFRSFEPDKALKFTFFNNAHNDLIEVAITGGLPALLVVTVMIAWWAKAMRDLFLRLSPISPAICLARASGWSIGIVLLASVVDYPLRTPLFTGIATLWVCWLVGGLHPSSLETRIA